jgi:hypothetical protein
MITNASEACNINQFKTVQRKVQTCSDNIHSEVEKLKQPIFNDVLTTETEYNSGEL